MTTEPTAATLMEETSYQGFRLQFGNTLIEVRPVAGQNLARADAEIQIDVFMVDEKDTQRCALTERVTGAQQLRNALTQWRAILS
ncbi:hypothetical protein [Streptomyces sp. 35G-GA-8]|uniref:hypothetical protein n=1 Tax=Streptomyces sp. 35G-GA-8 TaxID=2939434 RepID=UPI00201ED804|nr:hypothetical protein [Streptomyces sp. 35G-GA-8]MCL7382182.1 hypothetical protein [Streptomyces sp. 35G-GA-8]